MTRLIILGLAGALALAGFSHVTLAKGSVAPITPAVETAKQAELAAIRVHDSSATWLDAGAAASANIAGDTKAAPSPDAVLNASIGDRRGDMDGHFNAGFAGRVTAPFDIGSDLNDQAFGVLATDGDFSLMIGRAGSLTNGTRLALSWHRADGALATERLALGKQTLDVTWASNTQLSLIKAVGVQGTVGSVYLFRFYILGQLEFTATSDGDIDFAVMCLRYGGGGMFEPCPDFGSLGNGMVRVGFDMGQPNFRKDVPYDLFLDQGNQCLLLAGTAQLTTSDYDFAITRLNLFSGALDTGFAGSGKRTVFFDLGSTPVDEAMAIHVRPIDNKIVVAGRANLGLFSFRSAMAQLDWDGVQDPGFCAPAVSSCESPASHRSGRRLWDDDVGIVFSQVTSLLGGGIAPNDTIVVREQVPSASSGRGRVSRVAVDGGCSVCTDAWLQNFERIRPLTALTDFRFTPPFFFDFGVVVAGYGLYSTSDDSHTHVFRVRSDMTLDDSFTSGPVPVQQFYDFAAAAGEPAVSRPAAMTRDSRGRYLIAGSRRWNASNNDWDFALARLQHDVILATGFDY
ncbi:MAG: hypothetical protein IPH99_00010 [Xanthomonadales bacterium]|nr:hypothetical protein [Xanthomonadales bacterium]